MIITVCRPTIVLVDCVVAVVVFAALVVVVDVAVVCLTSAKRLEPTNSCWSASRVMAESQSIESVVLTPAAETATILPSRQAITEPSEEATGLDRLLYVVAMNQLAPRAVTADASKPEEPAVLLRLTSVVSPPTVISTMLSAPLVTVGVGAPFALTTAAPVRVSRRAKPCLVLTYITAQAESTTTLLRNGEKPLVLTVLFQSTAPVVADIAASVCFK